MKSYRTFHYKNESPRASTIYTSVPGYCNLQSWQDPKSATYSSPLPGKLLLSA